MSNLEKEIAALPWVFPREDRDLPGTKVVVRRDWTISASQLNKLVGEREEIRAWVLRHQRKDLWGRVVCKILDLIG